MTEVERLKAQYVYRVDGWRHVKTMQHLWIISTCIEAKIKLKSRARQKEVQGIGAEQSQKEKYGERGPRLRWIKRPGAICQGGQTRTHVLLVAMLQMSQIWWALPLIHQCDDCHVGELVGSYSTESRGGDAGSRRPCSAASAGRNAELEVRHNLKLRSRTGGPPAPCITRRTAGVRAVPSGSCCQEVARKAGRAHNRKIAIHLFSTYTRRVGLPFYVGVF